MRPWMRIGGLCCAMSIAGSAQDVWFPDGADTVTVPIRIVENGPLPRASAIVDARFGDHVVPMLLDTGASSHVVSDDFVERVKPKAGSRMFAVGMGDAQSATRYRLPTMRIGELTIENDFAVHLSARTVFRWFDRTYGIEVGGILGAGLFASRRVTIDFEGQRLMIRHAEADYAPPAGATVLPMEWQIGAPVVRASLCGRRSVRFLVDTGNDGVLVVHGRYAKRSGMLREAARLPEAGVAGAFTTSRGRLGLVDSIELGALRFADVPSLLVEPGGPPGISRGGIHAGNLGLGLWSRFGRMTLDYVDGRLILERRAATVTAPLAEGFGLQLRIRRGAVTVAGVLDGSPARDADIRVLDVVRAVDGHRCPESVTDTVRLLRAKERATIEVARHRSGVSTVTLRRRKLLPRAPARDE